MLCRLSAVALCLLVLVGMTGCPKAPTGDATPIADDGKVVLGCSEVYTDYEDITASYSIARSTPRSTLNRLTRILTQTLDVTLTYTGAGPLSGPVYLVVVLQQTNVTMPTATGLLCDGRYYYDITAASAGTKVPIAFRYASTARLLGYQLQVLHKLPAMVTVPNVVGMTQAEAQTALASASLIIGTVTETFSDTVPAGCVVSQDPAANASVARDSAVSLVLSKGPIVPPLTLQSKSLHVAPQALGDAGLNMEEYSVQSVLSQSPLTAKSVAVDVAEENQGQILFVNCNATGNTILALYVTPGEIAAGSFTITAESAAKALIGLNPYVMILSAQDRDALLTQSTQHALFPDLLSAIGAALLDEPENLLEPDIYPEIWRLAMTIGVEVLQQNYDKAGYVHAKERIGEENVFHLDDGTGGNIQCVNPSMVFYGVSVSDGRTELVAGKSSVLSAVWAWPPIAFTDPVSEQLPLGEGDFTLTAYKGFDANIHTAAGLATYANFFKIVAIVLDSFVPCLLDNGDIEMIVEFIDEPKIVGIEALEECANDWPKCVKAAITLTKRNWDEIAYRVWLRWPSPETASYMRNAGRLLGYAGDTIKVVGWANEKLPFFFDLVFAPNPVRYRVSHHNGVLTEIESPKIPPAAGITLVGAVPGLPPRVLVDTPITFDSSNSYDDTDAPSSLQVRWDFNDDRSFDTQWSTNKTTLTSYPVVGNYTVVLQVRDSDGLVGVGSYFLHVDSPAAQGTANHIIAFRNNLPWDSYAFENMMDDLGYLPGEGSNEYEVLGSSEMDSVILRPGVDLVIITNDQGQTFYNNLAANVNRFLRFMENGGTVLWGACDQGWAYGNMSYAGLTLPRGVTYSHYNDPTNFVVNYDSPLTAGLPYRLTGNYASHEAFLGLPADSIVYTEDTRGLPTLVEYPLAEGSVILTGQPIEWGYDRLGSYTIGFVYPNLINYVLGSYDKKQLRDLIDKGRAARKSRPELEGLPTHLSDNSN